MKDKQQINEINDTLSVMNYKKNINDSGHFPSEFQVKRDTLTDLKWHSGRNKSDHYSTLAAQKIILYPHDFHMLYFYKLLDIIDGNVDNDDVICKEAPLKTISRRLKDFENSTY